MTALLLTACVAEPSSEHEHLTSDARLLALKEGLAHSLASDTSAEIRLYAEEVSSSPVFETAKGARIGQWYFSRQEMTLRYVRIPEPDQIVSFDFSFDVKDDGKAWIFSELHVGETRYFPKHRP